MNNVVQFQRMHPLHREFAPNTIDGPYFRDPAPLAARILKGLALLAAFLIAAMFAGWGYQELSMVDWSAVAGLMGVVR